MERYLLFGINEYTGAVEPPVRRTGNRESGHIETDIYETKPLPQRY